MCFKHIHPIYLSLYNTSFNNFTTNLNTFFSVNHKFISEQNIPFCYKDIHLLFIYMGHFKQQPINTVDTLTQSLWLNRKKHLYCKTWKNLCIIHIKDILNKNKELQSKNSLINTTSEQQSLIR